MPVLIHSLLGNVGNVCCWRGPDLTALLPPVLLAFWMLLASLGLVDALAWALSAPSEVPDSVVVIHVMLLPCLTLLISVQRMVCYAPSELAQMHLELFRVVAVAHFLPQLGVVLLPGPSWLPWPL